MATATKTKKQELSAEVIRKLEKAKFGIFTNGFSNSKTKKSNKSGKGVFTIILHFAPANNSGYEVCPMASNGCRAACLYTAGRGRFDNIKAARIRRTKLWFESRDECKALIVAERIRERVEALELVHKGQTIKMTISGGISSSPIDGTEPSSLIENADKAMYMAKGIGKNNIILFSTEQRQYLRVDFKAEINVRTIDFNGSINLTARPKNICTGGILFESPNYMEIGTKVNLQIPVSKDEEPLTMIGTVVRVEALGEEHWDIGISFLEVDKDSRSEIARYLSKKLVSQ
jgi:hypothetical protein